jgi:hypothetical protein
MSSVTFYYGSKLKPVDFNDPSSLRFNNGSVFFTSLKEAVESHLWPKGFLYHCEIETIKRNRRLKEDSEPDGNRMLELMRSAPKYERTIKTKFSGNEKIAYAMIMDKSRTGAIVDLIRTTFYDTHNVEFCNAMVEIGYDGYYGKFHPPANFHTDREKFYYARLFDFDRIRVIKTEEINASISG